MIRARELKAQLGAKIEEVCALVNSARQDGVILLFSVGQDSPASPLKLTHLAANIEVD
jgi:hypothetical protein